MPGVKFSSILCTEEFMIISNTFPCSMINSSASDENIVALMHWQNWQRTLDTGGTVTFFLHLRKAFDTLDHEILSQKFLCYGMRGPTLNWFRSYLSDQKQKVDCDGVSSSWLQIKCDVAQRSISGPLLFFIYKNDLPNVCRSFDVYLFGDDTNLSWIGIHRDEIERDLSGISNWLRANKLILNVEKTVQLNILRLCFYYVRIV